MWALRNGLWTPSPDLYGGGGGGGGGLDGSESDGTNKITGGNNMASGWSTVNATLTTNYATAPNGASEAALFYENSSDNRHILYFNGVLFTAGITFSTYVKGGYGRRYLQIMLANVAGTNKVYLYYDTQTGTITDHGTIGSGVYTSSQVEAGANGFYKVTLVGEVKATSDASYFQYSLSNAATYGAPLTADSPKYTGDGSSGILLWRPKGVD